MLNQNQIEQIERYISGKADGKDVACVEKLFSDGHINFDLRNYLRKDWESDNQNTIPSKADFYRLQNHIHHMINHKENRKLFIHRFTSIKRKVAAILLLPLIIGGSLTLSILGKKSNTTRESQVSSLIHLAQDLHKRL